MRRPPRSVQLLLLMPLAAWSVHQLRYLLAYGPSAGHELSDQGHAYLTVVMPAATGLAAIALGVFVLRLRRVLEQGAVASAPELDSARIWAVAAAGLLAIYTGQELTEGLLATGHAPGLAGVFADGGWWSAPAALLVGGVIAAVLRGARAVETIVRAHARTPVARPARGFKPALPAFIELPAQAPLATMAAGRAPPVAHAPV